MSFSDRLKEARTAKNLKQGELGALIGVTGNAISNYENGTSSPNDRVLLKLFDVLEVEPNFLFQDSFTPKTKKAPAVKQGPAGNGISLEESNRLLVGLGFIKEGEQLSDEDLAFLASVIGLLDAWFSRKQA